MKHGLPDPVADAVAQPLRLAWDGVQLHAIPSITPLEIEGIIQRLVKLHEMQMRAAPPKPTILIPTLDERGKFR
ncbi:hypothetical protein [Silvimonas sp.]|uniref:hypothetical protein n=1 Tax=Silvimonas sp. TaxID=2650811 RepID=UPI00284CB438|nr:hypothetical protein [Silvimonas sp.]MDR3427779.1 hypothetical protein [Silvimonas sp.]